MFACPSCGQAYNVGEEHRGKKTRCRKCGLYFTLGDTAPAQEETSPSGTGAVLWHVGIGGAQRGPYTADQVIGLLESGEIGADALIWNRGMTEWQPVSSVAQFAAAAALAREMSGHPEAGALPPQAFGHFVTEQLAARMGLQDFQLGEGERIIDELEVTEWILFWLVRKTTAKFTLTSGRLLYRSTASIVPGLVVWFGLYVLFAIAFAAAYFATGGVRWGGMLAPTATVFSIAGGFAFLFGVLSLWVNLGANRRVMIPLRCIDSIGLRLRPMWRIPILLFAAGLCLNALVSAAFGGRAWVVFLTVPLGIVFVAGIVAALIWFRVPHLNVRSRSLGLSQRIWRQSVREAAVAGEGRVSDFVRNVSSQIEAVRSGGEQTSVHE